MLKKHPKWINLKLLEKTSV